MSEEFTLDPNLQRIYLIGMPASGKTTFGKALAEALHYQFIDTDELIERRVGTTIAELFRDKGEAHFRALEKETLQKTLGLKTVMATGGGMPCFFDNMDFILDHGVSIYLDVAPKELARRSALQHGLRPLLSEFDQDGLMRALEEKLIRREAFYEQANIRLSGRGITVPHALQALKKAGVKIPTEN